MTASTALVGIAPDHGDVCVVVPMYNEARVIGDVLTGLLRAFPHVVCVDDGSADESGAIAARLGAHVVRHPINLGQGAALQTGIEYALLMQPAMNYVVTFDADGQHRVEDAVAMVAAIRRDDVDVALGSRFLDAGGQVPFRRRLLLRAAVLFTRLTTGLPLTDAHNGLRVLRRKAAELVDIRLHGMAHASEIVEVVARSGLSYLEVPITVNYTDYSLSKGQSTVNAVNVLLDLLGSRIERRRRT